MGGHYDKSVYNQLMEVMERLDKAEERHKKEIYRIDHKHDEKLYGLRNEISELKGKVKTLEKENSDLRKENQLLKDDNARLRSIINNDSSNSSLPPSSDQTGSGKPKRAKSANEYNGREKTGRKAGGQKGHKGTTLTKSDIEKVIKDGECIHETVDIGRGADTPCGARYISKYIIDIDVRTKITELRFYPDTEGKYHIPPENVSDVVYGDNVKAMAVGLYSEGVMSNDRIAAFINTVGGDAFRLSEGSVYGFCKKFSEKAAPITDRLAEGLLTEDVVMTDATTVSVDGKQEYIRNFSSAETAVYFCMDSKTIKKMKEIPFLGRYAGTLVHDHETAMYHFGTGHGECNVHVIRYLRKNSEDTGNSWSDKMIKLLCEINTGRKALMAEGKEAFTEEELTGYEARYFGILEEGRKANRSTPHKYAKKEENALLNRLENYSANHLLFLHDFNVPFDDNMSERDLRKAKNRQKMAGGFRKESGLEMYCRILSIVETLKRRGMALLENIKLIFAGTPAIY